MTGFPSVFDDFVANMVLLTSFDDFAQELTLIELWEISVGRLRGLNFGEKKFLRFIEIHLVQTGTADDKLGTGDGREDGV